MQGGDLSLPRKVCQEGYLLSPDFFFFFLEDKVVKGGEDRKQSVPHLLQTKLPDNGARGRTGVPSRRNSVWTLKKIE